MDEAALLALATKARALVADHHMRAPLERGLVLETLRRQLGERAGLEAAEEALRRATSKHPGVTGEAIVVDGDVARLASFGATSPGGAVAGLLGAAMHAITAAALRGVTEHAIKEATQAPPKDVRALLAKLVREGFALHAGELWFSKAAYDALRAKVVEHLAKEKMLTIADFKAMSGLGRKQAIPLLEQLDREGVTRREGDDRMPGKTVT
jgi:selenocysteine-specific elongation factor